MLSVLYWRGLCSKLPSPREKKMIIVTACVIFIISIIAKLSDPERGFITSTFKSVVLVQYKLCKVNRWLLFHCEYWLISLNINNQWYYYRYQRSFKAFSEFYIFSLCKRYLYILNSFQYITRRCINYFTNREER